MSFRALEGSNIKGIDIFFQGGHIQSVLIIKS